MQRNFSNKPDIRQAIALPGLGLLLMLLGGTAHAQYNGHNLRGDFGMFSGSQPGPGWYAGVLGVNYDIDSVRGPDGSELASEGSLDINAIAPYAWWVSDNKVFGGNYSVFASASLTNNALEAPTLGISSDTETGSGDLYVQPIILGWHTGRADYMAGLGVFAPTGRYSDGASNNTGLGMWSYELFGGSTLYLDEARSWSLSALAFYETHSSKQDSDVKVGDLLTIEGGIGKSWADGTVALGLSYFAQWKVSEDKIGSGVTLPNNHQIFGAGPELVLPMASKEKFYGTLNLRYLWDFGVESNTDGNTFVLMATFPIPSIPLQ